MTAYSIYTGRVTNWPIVLVSTALAVLLLIGGATSDGSARDLALPILTAAVIVLLNVLTGISIRTAAGPNGVAIRFGPAAWPRCTYSLDRIASAEVVDIGIFQVAFGFWWTPRHTYCTVRTGPALRLNLTNGRRVTVTVPDARAAAAALREAKLS
ncbi:hypothetical protein [Dactylosporangium sp. NPDC051541]|uniref:hypothetical protein n=1 Tax=Dactylosporangium sp. NPDC051541 TaxID=3363977 RepID=UPI0037ABAA5B